MPNLVFLARPSLQIMDKTQKGVFPIPISDQLLIKENCHNSRTSDDIDMKLGPTTKFNRRKSSVKKIRRCWQIVMSLSFFQFKANLELSGSRIPGTWFVKLTFSLIVTCYSTKTANRTKKSLTQLSNYCFE